MTDAIATMASVQDKVRERIQSAFMDLIPPDLWEKMVSTELHKFTTNDLPGLVKQAAKDRLNELLKAELQKPEWAELYDQGPRPSVMLTQALRDAAPALVGAMFANLGEQIVMNIRNGQIRGY